MELMDFIVDFLPLFMFLMMGAMLFSGYPVAFILGGVSITFGLLGFAFDVFSLNEFLILLQEFGVLPLKI
ncbi:MAG: hypothetical protein CM15mP45_00520 [Deltaproteobacteria bacterium]|nr:MAG: hypothetical protein CM15mP45_00520 [Deltaproteobacteria bacterium]